MKRPEETNYPTTTKQLALSQQIISDQIDKGVWHFDSYDVVITDEVTEWLKEWGWSIDCYNDHCIPFFTLKPIGE